MEEGGGNSESEIAARLKSWVEHGGAAYVDIQTFGQAIGLDEHAQWFSGDRPPLQSTWSKLIRIALSRRGQLADTNAVREYQRTAFARQEGAECLLELLPLPSPALDQWHYGEWSDLPWLQSRDEYRAHLLPQRTERLRHMLSLHAPEAVIFYGRSYRPYWESITGVQFSPEGNMAIESVGATNFVLIPHPAAYGTTNAFFAAVGGSLRK